ncbi:hypothetical protein HBA55_34820 [Pseudomaricurvus alkylphenolicus]|uniref:hypothetical protein n=1 Tax=Pseudomaricurvus alkylphenolicus TaxID=1306991 RepID=UPI0014249D7B|nr:hypothetical protein [Pseudomaricurvus alkylphenolicus]NIB44806.1 hypothetical protein [Pseudomaricurvus alkylphenolicus]
MGATHVHAVGMSSQADRDYYERSLIGVLAPPLNVQHNPQQGRSGLLVGVL